MLELNRTVRMAIPVLPHRLGEVGTRILQESAKNNSFAAWPAPQGLSLHFECQLICQGEMNRKTGFFVNIRELDQHVRDVVLPQLCQLISEQKGEWADIQSCLYACVRSLQQRLEERFTYLELFLSPYLKVGADAHMRHILLKQMYEFSASHRLHANELSDEENRAIFGKCNHPSGHGHNYVFEVGVKLADGQIGTFNLAALDKTVDERVISQFDHKHLNQDCEAFKNLNPTVENIAIVIYEMLTEAMDAEEGQIEVDQVTVWETTKTSCTYRG